MRPTVTILKGDITKIPADAIVNAANNTLIGGGGVDKAIHQVAGPDLLKECKALRATDFPEGLSTGEAVVTGAYNLPAKHVIHVVGPLYGRDPLYLLKQCYRKALQLADLYKLESISVPAVSTGAYRVPVEHSARDMKQAIESIDFHHIKEIKLVLYSDFDKDVYEKIFALQEVEDVSSE
ncbi:MAG: macro domain-containing protein [Candidatus Woesearchaeota archaeon]